MKLGAHTGQLLYILLSSSPALILLLLSSKAKTAKTNSSVCTGISFTCQPRCFSDCQLQNTGQQIDTYKHTYTHTHLHKHWQGQAHKSTHARTRPHSSSHLKAQSVLAHFSSLFQTQQQSKLPLSKLSFVLNFKLNNCTGQRDVYGAMKANVTALLERHIHSAFFPIWYPDVSLCLYPSFFAFDGEIKKKAQTAITDNLIMCHVLQKKKKFQLLFN